MSIVLNKAGKPYDTETGKFVSWDEYFIEEQLFYEVPEEIFIEEQLEAERLEEEKEKREEEKADLLFIEEQLEAERLEEKEAKEDQVFIDIQIKADRLKLGVEETFKEINEWDNFKEIWDAYLEKFDLDEDEIGTS